MAYDMLIDIGMVLMEAKKKRVQKSFRNGKKCSIWSNPNHTSYNDNCYITNSNHDISDLGNYIAKQGYDIGIIWFEVSNKIVVSFRSIGDIDVSKIASSWGGGGHKNASGIQLKSLKELNSFIKNLL